MNEADRRAPGERIMKEPAGNLFQYAQSELARLQNATRCRADEPATAGAGAGIHTHGHSACAGYATTQRSARRNPDAAHGRAEEWHDVGEGAFQNSAARVCSRSQAALTGRRYDINGWCFGVHGCATPTRPAVPVTFPTTPTTYVDVPDESPGEALRLSMGALTPRYQPVPSAQISTRWDTSPNIMAKRYELRVHLVRAVDLLTSPPSPRAATVSWPPTWQQVRITMLNEVFGEFTGPIRRPDRQQRGYGAGAADGRAPSPDGFQTLHPTGKQ
jgi:hypothetical protein